ncbi:hypothetical protein I4U23_017933 [Adineta vaga]|nr:hypothetical protein I4U23_017933 [Adineta vaga]
MSITDQLSSTYLYNTNFLNALHQIPDETIRNRYHQYWLSLYQYFHYSVINQHALVLQEQRIREDLHRLDIVVTCQQTNVAYRIHKILKQGHQILADIHQNYDTTNQNLKEFEQNIKDLEFNPYEKKNSNDNISSITHLKEQINDLHQTREDLQEKLNRKKLNYFSMQIQVYYLQQHIHQTEKELLNIQHTLKLNLQSNYEQEHQLKNYLEDQQKLTSFIDKKSSKNDYQLIQDDIQREAKISIELKRQNKDLNTKLFDQIKHLKINETKQIELNINRRNLNEIIQTKQNEIEQEKEIKQNTIRIIMKIRIEFKNKNQILSIHNRQNHQLKNQLIQLEHHQTKFSSTRSLNTISKSTENIKQNLHQAIKQHSHLTTVHYHSQQEIHLFQSTIQEYISLVKEQREKILHYERLHDQWIIHLNLNRQRLVEFVQRLGKIQQEINYTNQYFQQLNQSTSNLVAFECDIHFYIQRRREKDNGIEMNQEDESKTSLNMKLYRMKRILHSNQMIFQELKQKISLIKTNTSFISNQILNIDKQRIHSIEYLHSVQDKSLVQQQQISNISKQYDRMKCIMELNQQKSQQSIQEKQKITHFLLTKQHLILLINKHIEINQVTLDKRHLSHQQLLNQIQKIRNQILSNIHQTKPPEMKQIICHLQNELFKQKKKTNDYQYQIHQQILINSHQKSILHKNHQEYPRDFLQKTSSIIYRLICKTHYNIILYKRLDILMGKISILSSLINPSLKISSRFYLHQSLKQDNQLKSSIAELCLLKK